MGDKLLKRSCPAVSQISNLMTLSSAKSTRHTSVPTVLNVTLRSGETHRDGNAVSGKQHLMSGPSQLRYIVQSCYARAHQSLVLCWPGSHFDRTAAQPTTCPRQILPVNATEQHMQKGEYAVRDGIDSIITYEENELDLSNSEGVSQ